MVPIAFVRQFAAGQRVGVDVADLEIVLVYVLALLNEEGLSGSVRAVQRVRFSLRRHCAAQMRLRIDWSFLTRPGL